ncbi:hypothetical protein LOK49_LG13G01142 [Camellia lanceoleosa]|uniref:Uncharacterized protein n=1 Tax=Camellia lanceoleosa TaxID=1840588 RepID=A0ACC0FJX0_9ERIC|nr:hypothetical protein LOK49_LG13G01142 [Camellia lanceoleosa]
MLVDRKNRRLGPISKPNGKSIQRPTHPNHRPRYGKNLSTFDPGPSLKVSTPNQPPLKQVGRKDNMLDKKSQKSGEGQSIDMICRGNEFTSNPFDCLQPRVTNAKMTTPSVIAAECIDGSVNLTTSPTLAPLTPVPPRLNCDSTKTTNPPSSTITLVTIPNPQPNPTVPFDHGAPGVPMETKVQLSSMGLFFNKLSFTASTHMDPVGKCGGIWMLWDPFKSTVMALDANSQVIHAKIKRDNFSDWILSAMYASPIPRSHDALWENLESVADNMTEPWLVAGDFNDFACQNEKRSFSTAQDHTRTRKFQARLNRCKLMDLGCSGPRLTWTNGRQGLANTLERLDRVGCNTEWRLQFQEGEVRNLSRTYSDHSPLIFYTEV